MKRAEVVDLLDERAMRGEPVIVARHVAWQRADGRLVWGGETMVWTEKGLSARRFDAEIAARLRSCADGWDEYRGARRILKRGKRHRVRPRHG